jgi:4-hydroxythreonine-4-phosphate dehydrogenase
MRRGKTEKPVIAITVGDFNGVGPEVVLKSLRSSSVKKICRPLLIGPREVFAFYARKLKLPFPDIPLIESSTMQRGAMVPGQLSELAGAAAAAAILHAVELALQGVADAIVTAPVSKRALHAAGYDVPGQTEMVQRLSKSKTVAMMLVSKTMRVGLATIHVPISKAARLVTRKLLREKIQIIHDALMHDWNIRSPKLAVLGLNPHASEGGDIGREDVDIVAKVVGEFKKKKMNISGPFPADAFFGKYKKGKYDGIVAMYHDQGLIPLKMSSFGKGVNISVGMNIVRTSPDHGTAFDIAGKGKADASSMIEAIKLATQVAANRKRPGKKTRAAKR